MYTSRFFYVLFYFFVTFVLSSFFLQPVFAFNFDRVGNRLPAIDAQRCETIKQRLVQKAEQLLEKGKDMQSRLDVVAKERDLNTTDIIAKKAVLESAIRKAEADIKTIQCPVTNVQDQLKTFKQDMDAVVKAAKEFRQAIQQKPVLGAESSRSAERKISPEELKKKCEFKVVEMKKKMAELTNRADEIQRKLEEKAKQRGVTVDPSQLAKAKQEIDSALAKAKEQVASFSCTDPNAKATVQSFKSDMKSATSSLRDFRKGIKDINKEAIKNMKETKRLSPKISSEVSE
jgi:chromosome segregation ATPase